MKRAHVILIILLLSITACGENPGRPVIAVTYGGVQTWLLTLGVDFNVNYIRALRASGAEPVRIFVTDSRNEIMEKLGRVDGVLIPGGLDLSPTRYGELPDAKLEAVDETLDDLEYTVLRYCREKNLPVLGICRGCQILNVFHGGSLYQDISTYYPKAAAHRKFLDLKVYAHPLECLHDVTIRKASRLGAMLGVEKITVNSYHHLGVKLTAPGFVQTAHSGDGFVEGIELPGKRFVVGVQFHPEMLRHKTRVFQSVFDEFVRAARESKSREKAL